MMKPQRECQFKGHQGTGCQYICTFNDCKLENRWVCSECLLEQLHHHGMQKQDHIKKQQQFLKYVIDIQEKCQKKYKSEYLKDLLKKCEQLIQAIVILKNQIISQIDYYNQQNNDLEDLIIKAKNDFYKLENSQIQQIMSMTIKKYDFKQYNELSKEICRQANSINKHIEAYEWETQLKHETEQIKESSQKQLQVIRQTMLLNQQNIQDSKYEYVEYFKYQKIPFSISQISQNGQYLVIGRFDKKIQVFDMRTKAQIVEFQSYNNNHINICNFTLEQKYLLCCDDKGYLSQYDVSQNFQFINANKIHKDMINDLVFMDNHNIITCSDDRSIQVRNIQSKQQIRIIENAHDDNIYAIDYNYDIIFSCSKDNSIRLFKQSSGKMLFKQEKIHNRDLLQIKLISNNRLISSSKKELILWDVNYDQKILKNIKIFNELNYNFTSVLDNTNIVLVCYNTVQILDNDLNLITSIKHDVQELSCNQLFQKMVYYRTVQQNQMNYLLIIGNQHLQILKRV